MRSRSLVYLLLLAAAVPAAADDSTSYNARESEVAESLVPSVVRARQAEEADLEWLLAVPPHVRSALVNHLGEVRHRGDAGAACDRALILLLERDPVENFRSRAASGIDPNGSAAVRDALVQALRDASPDVRLSACQTLMSCRDHSVAKAVLPLLGDESPRVRPVAARTLGWLDAKDALPAIRAAYAKIDPRSVDAVDFCEAFSRLGDEGMALKAVAPLLSDENWNVRFRVIDALQRVKSRQAVPLLINALSMEMQRGLHESREHHFAVPDRTMKAIAEQLDARTGQAIGVDPGRWMKWWAEHSAEYGTPASAARPPDGFDDLCARYMAAVKRGFEPSPPPPSTVRLVLSKSEGPPQQDGSGWSPVVDGVRLRLLAPSRINVNHTTRLNVLVQNTTDKPIHVGGLTTAAAIEVKSRQKVRKGPAWHLAFMSLNLPRKGAAIISVVVKPHSCVYKKVLLKARDPSETNLLEVTTVLPESVEQGRYRLVFAIDSASPAELKRWVAIEKGPSWQGSLVSPPVEVELVREGKSGKD